MIKLLKQYHYSSDGNFNSESSETQIHYTVKNKKHVSKLEVRLCLPSVFSDR